MKQDKPLSLLREHEAELKRRGIQHLYLFGFTARGEAKEDSDVDLFSTTKKESSVSLS